MPMTLRAVPGITVLLPVLFALSFDFLSSVTLSSVPSSRFDGSGAADGPEACLGPAFGAVSGSSLRLRTTAPARICF
uniref:Putative secreted peptide n=1 Tax=Anopheles braziliensis TaxID=58242 RepID=A0A2M3ZVT9_9DIPT